MSYPAMVTAMRNNTVDKIDNEIDRQNKKFGQHQFRDMSLERSFAVLTEEVGELAQAILKGTNVEEELLHVAAVAAHWLDEQSNEHKIVSQSPTNCITSQSPSPTLRGRAAAALERHRRAEAMQSEQTKRADCEKLQKELLFILGVDQEVTSRPTEVEGLKFNIGYDDLANRCLVYELPCTLPCGKKVFINVKIRSLADLGQALDNGPIAAVAAHWLDEQYKKADEHKPVSQSSTNCIASQSVPDTLHSRADYDFSRHQFEKQKKREECEKLQKELLRALAVYQEV